MKAARSASEYSDRSWPGGAGPALWGASRTGVIVNFKRPLTALLLAALAAPALAGFEIEVRLWAPSLDGQVRVSEAGDLGSDIDLSNTLGIDDDEFGEVRLIFHPIEAVMLRLGYTPIGYSGDATLSEDIEFGGIEFPVSIDVASELDLDYARFGFA